jgi:hypothetical protein
MELVLMDLDDVVDLLVDLWMREPEDTAEVALCSCTNKTLAKPYSLLAAMHCQS